jgi:hypothetical protein
MKLFKPWTWMKLDPTRTKAARDHFDSVGRYNEWHDLCRTHFKRQAGKFGGDLAEKGVEIVRCLTSKEASQTKEQLVAEAESFSAAKASIDYADVMRF